VQPQYPTDQQPPIIVQNAVNVGVGRTGHSLSFHVFMFFITGGLWLFIAPFPAARRRGGGNNTVNFR
jgi:hypothetical protein